MKPIRKLLASNRGTAMLVRIVVLLAVLLAPLSPQMTLAAGDGDSCAMSVASQADMPASHGPHGSSTGVLHCATTCPMHAAIAVAAPEAAPRAIPRVYAQVAALSGYMAPDFRFEDPPRLSPA